MRKIYEKPEIEISLYLVNEAFADCTVTVNLGPSTATSQSACSSYTLYEDLGTAPDVEWSSIASTSTMNFYYSDLEDTGCDCYYTSGKGGTILQS